MVGRGAHVAVRGLVGGGGRKERALGDRGISRGTSLLSISEDAFGSVAIADFGASWEGIGVAAFRGFVREGEIIFCVAAAGDALDEGALEG